MSEVKTAAEALEPLEAQLERLAKAMPLDPARKAEFDAAKVEMEERRRREQVAVLRSTWGAPRRHRDFTPKLAGEWAQKLELCKQRIGLAHTGAIVALIGQRGNGKTQLAVELMKWRTDNLWSALFTTAIEFFMAVKATYKQDSKETEADVLKRYGKPTLLVIDEVGKRGQSEWENNLLFELLNSRYNDLRDTVLIDNRTKDEFIEAIGPSLASRMNEGGGIIECNWPSFRD